MKGGSIHIGQFLHTHYLYPLIGGIIVALMMFAILYTTVYKPRKAKDRKQAMLDQISATTPGTTPTASASRLNKAKSKLQSLAAKSKGAVAKHIATVKGKIIEIGGNYDDLSDEEKEKVKACYEAPNKGCQF